MRPGILDCAGWLVLAIITTAPDDVVAQTERLEFFENRIRPVLVEHCYSCHNSVDTAEADLTLDWKTGIRSETSEGRVVVPFQPAESILLKVIRHEISGLEMPDGGPKLSAEIVADFEKWIADGAVDPRLNPPSDAELAKATSWDVTFERRKQWWSFQPIQDVSVPESTDWSDHPIDRFIEKKLSEENLEHSPRADRATLIRRLSYALTGLPPTADEIDQFVNDPDPSAYDQLVDRLLDSPRFGERWARHWMDLVRYADSHGSEGDPAIPNAYQYRDYLIRAFNQDVPYDQLVTEHIAGDLLDDPRINRELGINESAIGTAHYRLVFHGFAPTDALDEKVRFTDDQINVLSKTFQALTISCARCHDHKFDAISQADYYALFGILGSCRPAMQDVNLPDRQKLHQTELAELKLEMRTAIAEHWLDDVDNLWDRMDEAIQEREGEENKSRTAILTAWNDLHVKMHGGEDFSAAWHEVWSGWQTQTELPSVKNVKRWDLSDPADYSRWFPSGNGLSPDPRPAGEFSLATEGDTIVEAIYPSGVFTHGLSKLHRGVLNSPRFHLDDEYIAWLRVVGGGQPSVRYVVQNYPRDGTVYPINNINNANWYWHRFDMTYWNGDDVHLELATSRDAPLRVGNQDRSWFGIREVIVRKKGDPSPDNRPLESVASLIAVIDDSAVSTIDDLVDCIHKTLSDAIAAWSAGNLDDEAALFLNECLRSGLLDNRIESNQRLEKLVSRYRELESQTPLPTRVPGVVEADAFDQPLYNRGNHKQPLEPVRRRYLQAIDESHFVTTTSGRLELANAIVHPDNPLTSRVMVNRIWHYLFGQGLVATPDNFGQLGEPPSHPELLDYLAQRFSENGWSVKDSIRFVVTSETWRQASSVSDLAKELDPRNKWLSHANVRRLDAEAIRDSILFASGRLDETMYGPGFAANSDSRRRSIYVQSRRNSLDAFLNVFDSPVPFATTGRRAETNVPAQSLTLLNDPFVIELARELGQKIISDPQFTTDDQRRSALFRSVLGRNATEEELKRTRSYADETVKDIAMRAGTRERLTKQIEDLKGYEEATIEPVRQKLLKAMQDSDAEPVNLNPIAHWDFAGGPDDAIGELDGQPTGDAKFTEKGLVVSGNGFVSTKPIKAALGEKTLEVWVNLSTLDQRGGGVMSIQDLDGNVFDSIVFAEQNPRRWMAGSDYFNRTQPFGGESEFEAADHDVHIAITYTKDGTITAYRNGQLYGKPYRKSDLVNFEAEQAQVVFGIRHGKTVASGRMFQGTIVEARLYDRALTEEEIAVSAGRRMFVGRAAILAAMQQGERNIINDLVNTREHLAEALAELQDDVPETEVWTRIAHALFNLKEFIYVR